MFVSISLDCGRAQRERMFPLTLDGRAELAAAVTGQPVTLSTVTLQPGWVGVLTGIAVQVMDPVYDYNGSIAFALTVNGSPYLDAGTSGYWTGQRGSISSGSVLPTFIQAPEGAMLTFTAIRKIAAAQAHTIACLAVGWSVPRETTKTEDAAKYRV